MPGFSPETTIYLCADTGIDDYNKPFFSDVSSMRTYFLGKVIASTANNSYQRGDERQYATVDIAYETCMRADAIMWNNADGGNLKRTFIAQITGVEWLNPGTTRIAFEVDAYCTYCGEIEWQPCLVEREHVDNDWSGTNPNFASMGVAEDMGCNPDTIISEEEHYYTPDTFVVISPYAQDISEALEGLTNHGIYEGLNNSDFTSAAAVTQFLNNIANSEKANINNVIAIYSIPSKMLEEGTETVTIETPWTKKTYNNAKCFSSQYCTVELNSLLAKTVAYKPELFIPTNQFQFQVQMYFICGNGGFLINPVNYAQGGGSVNEMGMTINDLPQGSWVGDAYAQWVANNGISTILSSIANILGAGAVGAAGAVSGNIPLAVGGITGAIAGAGNFVSTVSNAKTNGIVSGGGGQSPANLAVGCDAYGFVVRVFMANEPFMKSIDSYFDRFGYKVNQLKTPNVNTRPKWNYVKCAEAHVGGEIPAMYRKQIEDLLNRGVTFWHTENCAVGDFSDPAGNKE